MLKVAFVAAIVMVSGINVFNAQKTEIMSDIAMANVEALASDGESSGIPWKGYVLDAKNSCCYYMGSPYAECSGMYNRCK